MSWGGRKSSGTIDVLPDILEYDNRTKLSMEREMVGFYITGHPSPNMKSNCVKRYPFQVASSTSLPRGRPSKLADGQKCCWWHGCSKAKEIDKNNHMMAFITLEDLYGTMEVIVFPTHTYTHLVEEEKWYWWKEIKYEG